jgi:hypothetical protein
MSSENVQAQVEGKSQPKKGTFVDALFDIGLAWAEFGVGQSKKAFETSAKTLEKVAHSLEDLQQKLRKAD